MELTIDFETRSHANLKTQGMWKYSEHESTEVLCLAVKTDDDPAMLWAPQWVLTRLTGAGLAPFDFQLLPPSSIWELINDAETIEAHNVGFERALWHNVMHKRQGWPDLPAEKLRCSAARAAMCSLPRALGQACEVLEVPIKKDMEGRNVMLRLCAPAKKTRCDCGETKRKRQKAGPMKCAACGTTERMTYLEWREDPADLLHLLKYCMTDTDAERALSKALPPLPPSELEIFQLDQEINARGIHVDTGAVEVLTDLVDEAKVELLREFVKLTGGVSPTQVAESRKILADDGLELEDLKAETVEKALAGEMAERPRRMLEIRQQISKTSTAKLPTLQGVKCADDRLRGLLMYHGASTGRWTGKHFQPQNLPSRGLVIGADQVDGALMAARLGGAMAVRQFYDEPMEVASACIRGTLVPSEGNRFLCADFSSIEGRGLAWLAEETPTLRDYFDGRDQYKVCASWMFNIPYDQVTKDQRTAGKPADLGLGYGGGIGAFVNFGNIYRVDYDNLAACMLPLASEKQLAKAEARAKYYLARAAEQIPWDHALAADIAKQKWRANRPATVQFWQDVGDAAMEAVIRPGQVCAAGPVAFRVWNKWLVCRLPSGRCLYYFRPHIKLKTVPWEDDEGNEVKKDTLAYLGMDSTSKKKGWQRIWTYGPKLVENITQAIARDLMSHAMLNLEKEGYPVVLTVHDEVLSDVPCGHGSIAEMEQIMCELPAWATGFPLAAEGWEGDRYRK